MKKELEEEIKKYYNMHKISDDINIINLSQNLDQEKNNEEKYFRCIRNYLEPINGGWGKKLESCGQLTADECFYCKQKLAQLYSSYKIKKDDVFNGCAYCYWFCSKQYLKKGGGLKLTKKQITKWKKEYS